MAVNLKRMRPSMVWLFAFALCLPLFVASLCKAAAIGSEEERKAQLVEGAKKEGSFLWYTSISVADADKLTKKFAEKYPFLKAGVYRGSGGAGLVTKIVAEARAKKNMADVTMNSGMNAVILQKAGLFAKYLSPEMKSYPEGMKDPEGYWTDTYVNLSIIAYNTRSVSPAEAPKTYEDLLNPKWKGRIGMDSEPYDWFYTMTKIMGSDYMKKLSEQRPVFSRGTTLISQLLAAGETSIAITVYNHTIEELKIKGAPVEWVGQGIPVVSLIHPVAVCANAPHPNAARLFVDFVLSKEGQELMASFYRIPTRVDVEPLIPKLRRGVNIIPWDPSIVENYEENLKQVREILMKKK